MVSFFFAGFAGFFGGFVDFLMELVLCWCLFCGFGVFFGGFAGCLVFFDVHKTVMFVFAFFQQRNNLYV